MSSSVTCGSNDNKLKILCIHGYRQNGDTFRQKTGALRKTLKKYVNFVFVTAPNEVPALNEPSVSEEKEETRSDQCGWWFTSSDKTFESKRYSELCHGFEKSVSVIAKVWEEAGPFDGLMGFSQGATLVSILCGMQQRKMLEFEFNFAILVAGFRSLCLPHDRYYDNKMSIPSLHVFGETDQVIAKERSELLATNFEDPVLLVHPGGHFVPASEPQKQAYISFIKDQLKQELQEGV